MMIPIPEPPKGQNPSKSELWAWLGELNRLKDAPGAPEEVRVRVLEHIELATVYLGLSSDRDLSEPRKTKPEAHHSRDGK